MKQKHRLTTPRIRKIVFRTSLVSIAAVLISGLLLSLTTNVNADRFDDQINALEQEIGQFEDEAAKLRARGDTLQNAVSAINSQKQGIQARIDLSQARYDKLIAQIKDTEVKISQNQEILGETVADLYVDSSVTPIEMIASSNSIGDYIDKQEYRSAIGDQLQSAINEIRELKSELEKKRDSVEVVLAEQKSQRDALAAKEAEQSRLLAQTRGNESQYRSLVSDRRSELQEVEEQQRAAYAAVANDARNNGSFVTVGGSGNYPWAGEPYPCWSYGCDDPWGLYYRECTSYVAWKLNNSGYGVRHFGGYGNAYEWPSTTASYTSQSSSPKAGAAAVAPASSYYGGLGHVMYVESVRSDGSIVISEYNLAGPGQYSERVLSPDHYRGYGFIFISFPSR